MPKKLYLVGTFKKQSIVCILLLGLRGGVWPKQVRKLLHRAQNHPALFAQDGGGSSPALVQAAVYNDDGASGQLSALQPQQASDRVFQTIPAARGGNDGVNGGFLSASFPNSTQPRASSPTAASSVSRSSIQSVKSPHLRSILCKRR